MIPAFRAAPQTYGGRAADPSALLVVLLRDDPDTIERVAEAADARHARMAEGVRVEGDREAIARLADGLAVARHPAAERLRRFLAPPRVWRLRTRSLSLDRPLIMAILNLTTDSFSGDGVGTDTGAALRRAERFREHGADIIDVGAESARADRPVMDEEGEAAIVAGVVRALVREGHAVSADTYKRLVARAALAEGAELVNDISGLTAGTAAAEEAMRGGAGYVLNYSYSPPKRRPTSPPVHDDIVLETLTWFEERVERLRQMGLTDDRLAVDPGIAFGKSHDEDLQVLRRVGEFTSLGYPLLLAHSRKNFIGSVVGTPASERDLETHVTTALAFAHGARIFRVHDVAGTKRTLALAAALTDGRAGDFAPGPDSWPWRDGATASHAEGPGAAWSAPRGQRW